MLVILFTTILLCALAVYGVVRATRTAMDRLGLDGMTVLLWFGLAER